MRSLKRFFARTRNLMFHRHGDERLREEMEQHIALQTEENARAGMSPEEAHRQARLKFGADQTIRESYHAEEGLPFVERLLQDIRFTLRMMRRSWSFSFVAVLTLGLGIGATAAMFSVTEAVVLHPLPYADVSRIVDIQSFSPSGYWQMASWPGYLEMRNLASTFEDLAGYEDFWGMTLKAGDRTRYLNVVQGTDNFFNVFGVRPVLGRTFATGEDQPGKNNVVVLSYEVWKQSFNGNSGVIGQTVTLDGDPYVVIGVMPAGFRFPVTKPNLLYIPVHVRSSFIGSWGTHWLMNVGRLKPGVSIQQAQADLSHVLTEIGQEKPGSDKGRTATVAPISTVVHGKSELPEIVVMLGAVFALLLIACANVAGLLLARGVTREREMALRVAIGAARGRLIRQLLVENSVLGILGGAAGLLFALGLLTAMRAFLIHAFMRGADIHLNVEVVLVTLLTGVFSSIGAGLIPAWRAAQANPNASLKSGASTGTSRQQHRLRSGFVIAQVSLSLLLLIFSGIMLLTLRRMFRKGQDPLAQAFQQKDGNNIAIVGVAGDARQDAVEPARPEIDFPLSRFTLKSQRDAGSLSFFLYVHTAVPPLSTVPQLRAALHEIAPTIAFQTPITMDDLLNEDLVNNRMESWVFGIFAAIAVFLVAAGIYGLLIQEVVSNTRDIGVRMALGASRAVIVQLMFRRIALLLAIGLGSGLCLALALRRVVAGVVAIQLARDGGMIATVVALLAVIGFVAALAPVRRAASIDPMQALRSE